MASNVCIDGLFLTPRYRFCGINRYLVNLLKEIGNGVACPDRFKFTILLPRAADANNSQNSEWGKFEVVACRAMRLRRLWKRITLTLVAKQLRSDAVFLPAPSPLYVKPKRLAITVHDIIPLLFPYEAGRLSGFLMRRHYLNSLRKADLIFTDSEHSKADILGHCALPSERVVVSYLGYESDLFSGTAPDQAAQKEILGRYGISQPYVLHVGMLEPRKNLIRLVEAYRQLIDRRRDMGFQLVLCGRKGWGYDSLLNLLREPWFRDRVILTGGVPDRDLVVLYKSAAGCAMPSVYEGFGLPVLEAMASGVPVMSSNRSSLPEVGGDAVLYFDPESVEEMSFAMERLLGDSELRAKLVESGLQRAEQFSWQACARTTLDALRNL